MAGTAGPAMKTTPYYVRCVRGDQPEQSLTYSNGMVTDSRTGLIWQQGEQGQMSWADALSSCKAFHLGGYADWRLPNIKELESLTDDAKNDPAIDKLIFTDAKSAYYWSSTTNVYNPGLLSWIVDFNDGMVDYDNKAYLNNVRCVRGGQSVTVSTSPNSPMTSGTNVTFSASVSGGSGTPEYQLWVRNPSTGVWTGSAYGTSPLTWDTTGLPIGTYNIQVWARNVGSTANYEAWTGTTYTLSSTVTPVSSVSLTSITPDSPRASGPSVSFTALASGGSGTPEYRLWVLNPSTGVWTSSAYGTSPLTWDTAGLPAGTYNIQVWARNVCSTANYEAWIGTTYTLGTPVSSVSLTSVIPANQSASGTSVSFTALASGGSGTPEYQLWVRNPSTGVWTSSAYSTSPLIWDTTGLPIGTYNIQVWARNVGSTANYEAWIGTTYKLGTPVSSVSLTSVTPDSPRITGTSVSFTALASGGSGTPEYQLWVRNPSTGGWSSSAYSTSPLTWDTTGLPAGTYNLQVWARNAGSMANYEAWTGTTYVLLP